MKRLSVLMLLHVYTLMGMLAQNEGTLLMYGRVTNQNGMAVVGATISFSDEGNGEALLSTVSDADGNYQLIMPLSVPLSEIVELPPVKVSAEGYAVHWVRVRPLLVWDKPLEQNFSLYSELTFASGQQATLVLPVKPDPTAGAYYGLQRLETGIDKGSTLVFARVMEPEANIPYIFVPVGDYTVSLKGLDLTSSPKLVSVGMQAFFISTYESTDMVLPMNYHVRLLDSTPDCHKPMEGDEYFRLGAMHGCLLVDSRLEQPLTVVLEDGTSGLKPSPRITNSLFYDLQGRHVTGIPRRGGVYMHDGKKVVVK